ncbi:prenyl cysteine carboxyl methyltransferas-like protein Ste14 [Dothidotthia symphoricarpi CBS 119687]|uniref:Protein-S-isoprenylcysteine O-methyltransferase n=1 Tax=Dothidotthia symphoricarpi CBS 119687 TaxID=1392245 RepID=A0A6A6A2Q3_9PLEO|nr:prenyl cysteine carboxyl methyltransferas-like protein Ste14 [Dothidotthia symphoricarpi CBS 119687]KAF2126080.1 prenyl cysteine carboxyl methyltransferas-like protein Ste14 [Dothidotthia symphoricarpi CBS 119687]
MASNGSVAPSHVDISFPVNRPTQPGEWTPELDTKLRAREASNVQTKSVDAITLEFFPGGKRSLVGIAVRAFCLGCAAVFGFLMTALLAYHGSQFWRPCFFLGTLSIFHFLEFYTTAGYNTPGAFVSSFLLTNGTQYRIAHGMAFIETFITTYFFPKWQTRVSTPSVIALGIAMIIVGQVVRSVAMAQAGTNFNHKVQSRKKEDHELVTNGLYAYFRHPSYFGFFWWGIGTQVMLGNVVSFLGYTGVLWWFFSQRISHEEKHLIGFFGHDYEVYKKTTRVWIPFI